MNKATELDVVIVNYNSGQVLEQCLTQLIAEPGINVNVVDNDSSDESLSYIEGLEQSVSIIRNTSNVGFSIACNQGAKSGKAPQIAFINPDCFINRQQLAQLSMQLSQNKSAALIGCRVLNEDGSLQAASRRRLPTFWRITWHLTGLSKWSVFKGININDSGTFDSVQTVDAVNGACVLVKREVFEQLGGFDEDYPLHFEDLDLFANLKARNRTLLYDSSVQVVHLQGHSKQQAKRVKLWKKQGLVRFMKKHRPNWEYQLTRFFLRLK